MTIPKVLQPESCVEAEARQTPRPPATGQAASARGKRPIKRGGSLASVQCEGAGWRVECCLNVGSELPQDRASLTWLAPLGCGTLDKSH